MRQKTSSLDLSANRHKMRLNVSKRWTSMLSAASNEFDKFMFSKFDQSFLSMMMSMESSMG